MAPDLNQRIERAGVVGCAVGRLRSGEEAEFVFHGSCSSGGDPISASVLWEAASLGKPLVALLAARRAESDPALLDRALATDLAAFGADDDERWDQVNLIQLLTHSAGLPNWRDDGQPLAFEADPGTPGYSGEGYELMLSELALHAGLDSGPMLDQHLADWQMTSSTFTADSATGRVVALGHDETGTAVAKQYWETPKAASSLHTTMADYMTFLEAVARPSTVVDPSLQAAVELLTQRQTELLPGFGRTLGWAFVESEHGDVLWQHGDNPGFKHVAVVRPATGEALVVFTNDDNGQPLYRELCREFLAVEVW